jgi:hypothetical protein
MYSERRSPGSTGRLQNTPCVAAFNDARRLPATLRGPVDFLALRRLARTCAREGLRDPDSSNL